MPDPAATIGITGSGFKVSGVERINYDFEFADDLFDPEHSRLAECYQKWSRCLAVTDANVSDIYGEKMNAYFNTHGISLTIYRAKINEKTKTMDTMLRICEAMADFRITRKEPVLVVGGGLVTDVAGLACASYQRNTNYIRVPTTVIGLIDASVSIGVAINHGKHKNCLGAYHAPIRTFLDFTFLKTLPEAHVRNGFAELVKISACAERRVFELLDQHCGELISKKFGRTEGSSTELRAAADEISYKGILRMLELETLNLHELNLDRVIAYGHTWSPTLELAPSIPLRHGHAISVDMTYSTTLALFLGRISEETHAKVLELLSRAGLSIDHELFTEALLAEGAEAILKTRGGGLRIAVPCPIGECEFLNDITAEQMKKALVIHKDICKKHPRGGAGIEPYVDASDPNEMAVGETEEQLGVAGDAARSALDREKMYGTTLPVTEKNGLLN